jgi:excinuclease ABC subunit C
MTPGVYLMKDKDGTVLYVGKATSLRTRVKQYFGATSDTRIFVSLLDEYLDDIDVIITNNEKEALLLENELIKRHQPRFNVNLKDDKNFLHLRIDDRVDWPRIEVVRSPRKDGAMYFGPYHSASKIRRTIKLVERYFGLRNCDDLTFKNRSRPCLQYQIKRCPAPCVLPVDREIYDQQVQDIVRFLQGRHVELAESLRVKMDRASATFQYENAARYRDQLLAITGSLEEQGMVEFRDLNRDVFGLYREGAYLQLTILFIRKGRMVGSRSFGFEQQGVADSEVLSTFANIYYNCGATIPDEILMSVQPLSVAALTAHLSEIQSRKVRVRIPQRGPNRKLLLMANKNAEHAYFQAQRDRTVRDGGLVRLKELLRLTNVPRRIECYDISLFQGASPVGSQVAFEDGVPNRRAYRHYKIKSVIGTDDYAMMRELLSRRIRRGLEKGDLPQLMVVDGGKGQLNVALALLSDLKVDGVDVVGLAKARVLDGIVDGDDGVIRSAERVFIRGIREPIVLRTNTHEFFLMTKLRDEAHRFAITFHRKQRLKKNFQSPLDEIPGVGKSRRHALMLHFGSMKAIKGASIEDISRVAGFGQGLAESVFTALKE